MWFWLHKRGRALVKNYAAGENSKSLIYFLSLEDDLGNLGGLCPQVRFHVHGAVQLAETFCSANRLIIPTIRWNKPAITYYCL